LPRIPFLSRKHTRHEPSVSGRTEAVSKIAAFAEFVLRYEISTEHSVMPVS
jgi:hypothetical protein